MEVLFVGLGSIGTRHLRNLFEVAKEKGIDVQADALRSSMRPLAGDVEGLLRAQYVSYDQLGHYDAAFITNPTHLHAHTLAELAGKVDCFFIEKPIFEGTGYDLAQLGLGADQKAYVAAPMRWCGTFLVDYRTVYSAHKEMGGGVTIDLIHEWDYLVDLFGAPLEAYNFKGTYSHLEIDSDDLSVYIARYPSLLAEVHLDYFGRTYRRTIELFCKEGTVTADFGAGTLTLENGEVIHCEEPVNQRYLREMAYFLDYACKGEGESINSPAMAQKVLGLTLGETM